MYLFFNNIKKQKRTAGLVAFTVLVNNNCPPPRNYLERMGTNIIIKDFLLIVNLLKIFYKNNLFVCEVVTITNKNGNGLCEIFVYIWVNTCTLKTTCVCD